MALAESGGNTRRGQRRRAAVARRLHQPGRLRGNAPSCAPSTSDIPSAVFVCNDLMAIGALRAAHESGVRVPDELSIVGFDDIELSAYTSPALTTVAQPRSASARWRSTRCSSAWAARRRDARKVVLQPELHVRASTARHRLPRAPRPHPSSAPSSADTRKSRTP